MSIKHPISVVCVLLFVMQGFSAYRDVPGTYPTILAAYNAAANGDVIRIYNNGVAFPNTISGMMNKSVTFRGYVGTTAPYPTVTSSGSYVFNVGNATIRFQNLVIQVGSGQIGISNSTTGGLATIQVYGCTFRPATTSTTIHSYIYDVYHLSPRYSVYDGNTFESASMSSNGCVQGFDANAMKFGSDARNGINYFWDVGSKSAWFVSTTYPLSNSYFSNSYVNTNLLNSATPLIQLSSTGATQAEVPITLSTFSGYYNPYLVTGAGSSIILRFWDNDFNYCGTNAWNVTSGASVNCGATYDNTFYACSQPSCP